MSKGSIRRPAQVSDEIFDDNWDRIFGPPQPKDHYVRVYQAMPDHCRLIETLGPFTAAVARNVEIKKNAELDASRFFTTLERVEEHIQ